MTQLPPNQPPGPGWDPQPTTPQPGWDPPPTTPQPGWDPNATVPQPGWDPNAGAQQPGWGGGQPPPQYPGQPGYGGGPPPAGPGGRNNAPLIIVLVVLALAIVGGGAYFLTKDDDDKTETSDRDRQEQDDQQDQDDDDLDLPTDDTSDVTLPDEPDDSDVTLPTDDDVATDTVEADAVLAAFLAAEIESDCETMWTLVSASYGTMDEFVPVCEEEYASYDGLTVEGEPVITDSTDTSVSYEVEETLGGQPYTATYTVSLEDGLWLISDFG